MEIDTYALEQIYNKNFSFEERKTEYDKYSIDDEDRYGNTLFHTAVKFADSEIFEYLFEKAQALGKKEFLKQTAMNRLRFSCSMI